MTARSRSETAVPDESPVARYAVKETFRIGALNPKLRPICGIQPSMIDHPDFSVAVKRRGAPPNSWRWEIYRAGRISAIECSEIFFETMTEASRAGKAALNVLLSEHSD